MIALCADALEELTGEDDVVIDYEEVLDATATLFSTENELITPLSPKRSRSSPSDNFEPAEDASAGASCLCSPPLESG
jgi:hypothetical protein